MTLTSILIRLVFFLVIVHNVEGQFGEIASIVTGLLGAGGGAGSAAGGLGSLGSLAGSAGGLSGLAGTGASAGAGAANALGSFGQLYQMAQAALQLTGTGVGIVNQASESAWFPAALENVARTNRELQDRILAGQGAGNRKGARPSVGMSSLGGFPDLFPGLPKTGHGIGSVTPVGGSEIGTEFGKDLLSKEDKEETGSATTDETSIDLKPISTKGDEDVIDTKDPDPSIPLGIGKVSPLFPVQQRTLLPGEVGIGEGNKEEITPNIENVDNGPSDRSPTITVQLPKGSRKPQLEFSTDSNEETFPLLPPRAVSPNEEESIVDVHGDKVIPQMVPELKKLLTALQKSNLTTAELLELTKQLEGDGEIGAPRENTTREPTPKESDRTQKPKTQSEQAAIDRNLLALRRALSSTTLTRNSIKKFAEKQASPPIVITLPKASVSSSTDVKLPAQKRLTEILEASTIAPSRSALTTLSADANKSGVKSRQFMIDGVSNAAINGVTSGSINGVTNALRHRVDTETKRPRIVQPKTRLITTTQIPQAPQTTTISYNEYYRQYYQQYYQQNPQAQIYNYYNQNPFGQLFQNQQAQNAQQFGQQNVVMQRPVVQQQYYPAYNSQYSQQTPQFYQQRSPYQQQSQSQANYYSTAQQQTQAPRQYPVRFITNPVLTTPPSKLGRSLKSSSNIH